MTWCWSRPRRRPRPSPTIRRAGWCSSAAARSPVMGAACCPTANEAMATPRRGRAASFKETHSRPTLLTNTNYPSSPERPLVSALLQSKRQVLIRACALATVTVVPVLPSLSHAQAWPTARPITMVVGFPAGGSADMIARTIAEPLGKRLGTPVVIENVSGAGGTIAGQKVANAAADGYTLFMASGSEVSIARLFNPAVKYNGETDFTHIGLVGDVPLV